MKATYESHDSITACGVEIAGSEFENKHCSQFSHLFKAPSQKNSQNQRRQALLKEVKKRHNASIDEKRGISEILDIIEDSVAEEPMDVAAAKTKKKKKSKYAGKLMLSEYLKEMPMDFEHDWLYKCCPTGVRSLVVADCRSTKSFNKSGYMTDEFESLLPGGGPNNKASRFTILDCIYIPVTGSYYVLDILSWNSFCLLNCSAEFRFYFLKSKLEENPELSKVSKHNRRTFHEVAAHPAQLPLIENSLTKDIEPDAKVTIDGVLFYHSEVDYRAGITPLVGWLKPYMVPEILHIPIHPDYLAERPAEYRNLEEHIQADSKSVKKRSPRKIKDVEMVEDFNCDVQF